MRQLCVVRTRGSETAPYKARIPYDNTRLLGQRTRGCCLQCVWLHMELPFPCVQQQAQSPFQHLYPGCQSQSLLILLRHQPGWISPCFLRGEMVVYAAWWHEAGVTGRAHHRAPAGVRRGNLGFRLWGERGAWPNLKALSLGWDGISPQTS